MMGEKKVISFSISSAAAILLGVLIGGGSQSGMAQEGASYPAPRFPQFLVAPSQDEIMEAARVAVRQTHGRAPLGKVPDGQTVHVFLNYSQDMEVWEAIKAAWAERGVQAIAVTGWDLLGITREEYEAQAKANQLTGADGWKEFGVFEPAYAQFFPPEIQKSFGDPMTTTAQMGGLEYPPKPGPVTHFMKAHPEVRNLVAYAGGRGFVRAAMGPEHEHKFVGNWIYQTRIDLLSKERAFPPDLWKMIDEEMVRPIPHVAEGVISDPEGTNLQWSQTVEQSLKWESVSGLTSYEPGHLNLYPPAARATWKPSIVRAAGNHTGYFPTMAVHLNEHGRVTNIEDGGKAGDLFRMLLEHPKFKNADFESTPEKGYWHLTQDGMGTNPKSVRNFQDLVNGTIDMANLSERNRAGIIHLSFSHAVDRDNERDLAYAKEHKLPLSHTAHMHIYFSTVKWKMRDTGEWLTVLDKGELAAFGNPEVRALAAKYGDPDVIFSYDWIPAIPGVNTEGDYERDYAKDPWAHIRSVWDKIKKGSYQHYIQDYDMFAEVRRR